MTRRGIQFDKVLVIFNPASTNASHLQHRINQLQSIFSKKDIIIIKTSSEGREVNKKIFLEHKELFGPRTLLGIAAGDGTVNLVIEVLLTEKSLTKQMREMPILPLWGGNANDLAHMLNGNPWLNAIKNVIKKGSVHAIFPLRITLKYKGGVRTEVAACYASFGAIAYAAHHINRPSHRRKPLTGVLGFKIFFEAYTVTKALLYAKTFKIQENGETKSMYEYAMINGTRMAKIERMPVNLNDKAFYVGKISRKHPMAVLYALNVLRQKRVGRITSQERELIIMSDTWLQRDGEVLKIKAGTTVSVELSNTPFYALSKKLRRHNT